MIYNNNKKICESFSETFYGKKKKKVKIFGKLFQISTFKKKKKKDY